MKAKLSSSAKTYLFVIMALFLLSLTVPAVGIAETAGHEKAESKGKAVVPDVLSNQINPASAPKTPGVIFYEKKNFRGPSKRITANTHMLSMKISSLKLDGVSSVAVFSSSSFNGNCEVFTSDQPNLAATSIGDNTIESAKPNGNCRCSGPYVFLFEHNNYGGRRFRLTDSSADLSNRFAGNMDNKVSSIKMFNMNSAALYSDKNYNGKCHTMKSHIPNMANTVVKNDALSSIKFKAKCKEERFLKVRNNSAAVVKFSWLTNDPLHPRESVALAVGREKIFNYKLGTKINLIVYFGYPTANTATNMVDFKQKCSYNLTLNENYFVVAKGTLINPKCENVVIPTI